MSRINVDAKDVVLVSKLQIRGPPLPILVAVVRVYDVQSYPTSKKRTIVIRDYTADEATNLRLHFWSWCADLSAIGDILLVPNVRLQKYQGEDSAYVNDPSFMKIDVNILSHKQFLDSVLAYKRGTQKTASLLPIKTEKASSPTIKTESIEESQPDPTRIRPVQRLVSNKWLITTD
jgi:hypothetical protein